jgi:hypothetical protein
MKRLLLRIWQGWKKIARAIGVFNTKVILTILYFIVLGIFSLIVRLLRLDLLDKRLVRRDSYWHGKEEGEVTLERCRRQF